MHAAIQRSARIPFCPRTFLGLLLRFNSLIYAPRSGSHTLRSPDVGFSHQPNMLAATFLTLRCGRLLQWAILPPLVPATNVT